jgi:hypothetical protein
MGSKRKLESRLDMGNVSLRRVGWNTLWSTLLGASFHPREYMAPIGAAIGLGLTLYDETTKRGMNLAYPFWGTLVGEIVGSVIDNHSEDHTFAYLGAAVGLTLGLAKTFSATRRK